MAKEKEASAPDIEEKVRKHESSGGRARRKLHTLEGKSGYTVLESDVRGPTLVSICPMDTVTTWRRVVSGGKDSEFEQVS